MRALIVGEGEGAATLRAGLERAGIELEQPVDGVAGAAGIGGLAKAIVALERFLAERPVDAVVLVGASDAALAALIVASKLELPVARVRLPSPAEDPADPNRRLIESLADAELADEGDAVVDWVRGT